MPCQVPRDPEVEKAFWNEAKGMLASPMAVPEEVIAQIAKKHGIGADAVGAILSNRKMFQLTNETWAKQAKLANLRTAAKAAASSADDPKWLQAVKKYNPYEFTRKVLTIGHGGVIPFTHARTSMFVPGEQGIFGRAVARAYSYITKDGGSARWRRDMAVMRADPRFKFWDRNGLDIKLQSQPVGMGMSRWTRQSFDALKPMRLELAEKYWKQLDPADRTAEMAQDLAKRINHATGTVSSPPIVNKIAGKTMFAPKLRFAKYASATDTFASQFGAKRFAKLAAVNLGLLGINDLFNRYVLNSNDNINWSDPARADWLRMKLGGMTIPMAPLFETMRLPIAAGAVAMNPNEDNKAKVLTKELASAVHPGINAIYGGLTGTDLATGKALPFKGASQYIYGEHRGEKKVFGKLRPDKFAAQNKIGAGEYASGYLPIPLQPVVKEMAKEGVMPDMSVPFLKAYAETILSGGAGTHAYPDVPYKRNP